MDGKEIREWLWNVACWLRGGWRPECPPWPGAAAILETAQGIIEGRARTESWGRMCESIVLNGAVSREGLATLLAAKANDEAEAATSLLE